VPVLGSAFAYAKATVDRAVLDRALGPFDLGSPDGERGPEPPNRESSATRRCPR
jgi:hypothetical protein